MKIAVIGAGPAGLSAAMKLAEAGESPTVFEKMPEVGFRVRCAEALYDLYNLYDRDPPGARVRVEEVLMRLRDLHVLRSGDINIWVLDKDRWLRSLAAQVESLGGRVLTDTDAEIADLRRDFDYVLDCSGFPSQSWKEYHTRFRVLALGIQYAVRGDVSRFFRKLYFKAVPGEISFRWIFPKSEGEANVGAGWAQDPPAEKWAALKAFASSELGEYEVVGRTSGYIPMGIESRLAVENVLFCGDAGGLANPYTGGGNHIALLSGSIAADCLLERKPQLYERRILSAIQWERKVAAFAESLLETSYRHHEKVVAYLKRRFSLGTVFTEPAYRKLAPYVQLWRLRCLLLGRRAPG